MRAKNIRLVADGGGDDGDVTINANHILNLKANHDVRVTSDNTIAMTAKDMNLIVQGFYELKYGFAGRITRDSNFGAASTILNAIDLKYNGSSKVTSRPDHTRFWSHWCSNLTSVGDGVFLDGPMTVGTSPTPIPIATVTMGSAHSTVNSNIVWTSW